MSIRKLIIEDVRCFTGRQEFNIRPLTFLVGENSTGKSTALGCFQTLHSFTGARHSFTRARIYGADLDFNVEPYQMGAFTDIVRRSTPQKRSFRLGFEFESKKKRERVEYLSKLTEKGKGSEPTVQEQKIVFPGNEVVFVGEKQTLEAYHEYQLPDSKLEILDFSEKGGKKRSRVRASSRFYDIGAFRNLRFTRFLLQHGQDKLSHRERKFLTCVEKFLEFEYAWYGPEYGYSLAPIRSKPQRTYDPLKENISPEGGDIPIVLSNMFRTDKNAWKELKERLIEFGRSSGLFTDIHVRGFGKSLGNPFQLQIKVRGPRVNMIDVGYGVNQLLPILVRLLTVPPRTTTLMTFLMQQPEVHLHPKCQAELSSLLISLVKLQGHSFVIETHSDYMVDRVRIEIMRKRISPEDVSLIYLEPAGNHVKVHNITFDEQANLQDAPPGYREFFLKESDKLLGFNEG